MKFFSVREFCTQLGISRAFFYKLVKHEKGPRITKIGSRTLISSDAAQQWQRKMEEATQAA
jgi:excisionase family DNA binding protein